MLQHVKANYITLSTKPSAFHLGDIINIIQQYHLRSLEDNDIYNISSNHICDCGCNINTGKVIHAILSLLDTRINYSSDKLENRNIIEATPFWFKKHESSIYDSKPYAKGKIESRRRNYVVCQFDANSARTRKEPDSMTVTKILRKFNNLVNIGNKELRINNACDTNLKEKFDLIANAQFYIGIDSGLTHLALMTNTPIFVIHPLDWQARKYYPESKQMHYASTVNQLFGQVRAYLEDNVVNM
jgi:Glycosyltransferase family 9 (heptosyltransferase)